MKSAETPISIGSRRELMVDDYLVAEMRGGACLKLHHPNAREIVLVADQPWEGNQTSFITVFQDGDRYRMYYQARALDLADGRNKGEYIVAPNPMSAAYAESTDGIHWAKPELGIYQHNGSRNNNIVWEGIGPARIGTHGFAPFKDDNPDVTPEARYKAVGYIHSRSGQYAQRGLYGMQSPDGIHWRLISDEPLITKGRFDSQNLVFRDSTRHEYRAYIRDYREGMRDIRTAVSPDFLQWSEPEWLAYPGAPVEQLYTMAVMPYYRAPHIFVGFPNRYVERTWSSGIEDLPELEHRRMRSGIGERFGTALTDGLFMSSRDGKTFKRWGEAFIRPGPQLRGNWTYGDNRQCWGMLELPSGLDGAPPELSFYATEGHWRTKRFRRYSLRIDGFVSANGPLSGGEFTSKAITFEGKNLEVNFSSSAAGSMRVELQNADGEPQEGFSLDDCHEMIGDELDRVVKWRGADAVSRLAGKPLRLRFVMHDADLYSFRFSPA